MKQCCKYNIFFGVIDKIVAKFSMQLEKHLLIRKTVSNLFEAVFFSQIGLKTQVVG
jgi:hypothetical protein